MQTIEDKVYLIRGTFPFDSFNSSFYVSIGVTQLGEVRSSRLQDLEIEGVFRATKDYIDFCLVKGEVNPFISQIELRSLPEEYLHDLPASVLKLISRNNLGDGKDDLRYVNLLYFEVYSFVRESASHRKPIRLSAPYPYAE